MDKVYDGPGFFRHTTQPLVAELSVGMGLYSSCGGTVYNGSVGISFGVIVLHALCIV